MTQEVQPLTWQKRTNIEEHQQFFSKINEIIDNLAPTVEEAEAAIAQATAAIASANDAIATANAASAAASAAASQAQTAASTVAGYDARLTAAEDDIDTQGQQITVLQGRAGALETGMTALGTRMTAVEGREADYLKKAGAAQTVTSQIMVPTTATGLRDTQIANGTRIQNDLDAYQAMVRNSGGTVSDPFVIAGVKEYTTNAQKTTASTPTGSSGFWVRIMKWDSVPLRYNIVMTVVSGYYRDANFYGKLIFGCWDRTNFAHLDMIGRFDWSQYFKLTFDGSKIELWYNNTNGDAGRNVSVFVDIETANVTKTSAAVAIPASEQVAEAEPDWTSFTRKLDCTFMGWTP